MRSPDGYRPALQSARSAWRASRPNTGRREGPTGRLDALGEELRPPSGEQRIESRAPGSGDRVDPERVRRVECGSGVRPPKVHLREHDAVRTLRQVGRVRGDLGAEAIVLGLKIHRVDGNQKREQPRALDVAQELEAEAATLMGALDDARDIGDDERAAVAELDD